MSILENTEKRISFYKEKRHYFIKFIDKELFFEPNVKLAYGRWGKKQKKRNTPGQFFRINENRHCSITFKFTIFKLMTSKSDTIRMRFVFHTQKTQTSTFLLKKKFFKKPFLTREMFYFWDIYKNPLFISAVNCRLWQIEWS